MRIVGEAVMPGLVPGIHVFRWCFNNTWMAGTSPAMTVFVWLYSAFAGPSYAIPRITAALPNFLRTLSIARSA